MSGRFAYQWKLRATAQGAALTEAPDGTFRRFLAYDKSYNCADAQVGESVLFRKAVGRRCAPRGRGPAKIRDADDAGATVKFRSQTRKMARYRLRGKVGARGMGEVYRNPGSGGSDTWDGMAPAELEKAQKVDRAFLQRERNPTVASTAFPRK